MNQNLTDRFEELLESNQSDPEIQYQIGLCYQNGQGVEQNGTQALQWLRRAADQGHEKAQALLASMQPSDGSRSGELTADTLPDWCLAAEQGDPEAQYQVGCYFLKHSDTQEDGEHYLAMAVEQGHGKACLALGRRMLQRGEAEHAIPLLRNSADCGEAEGATLLGQCYLNGTGVAQDLQAAERYLTQGAEAGGGKAMLDLALRLAVGDGLPMSRGKAMGWVKRAENAGISDARAQFDQAEKRYREKEARRLEQERQAEEARKAQEARQAEEARKAEEQRRAEEEETRKAEEAKKAEEARRAQEAKQAEEARRAQEAKQAEEVRRAQEAQKAAEKRRSAASPQRKSGVRIPLFPIALAILIFLGARHLLMGGSSGPEEDISGVSSSSTSTSAEEPELPPQPQTQLPDADRVQELLQRSNHQALLLVEPSVFDEAEWAWSEERSYGLLKTGTYDYDSSRALNPNDQDRWIGWNQCSVDHQTTTCTFAEDTEEVRQILASDPEMTADLDVSDFFAHWVGQSGSCRVTQVAAVWVPESAPENQYGQPHYTFQLGLEDLRTEERFWACYRVMNFGPPSENPDELPVLQSKVLELCSLKGLDVEQAATQLLGVDAEQAAQAYQAQEEALTNGKSRMNQIEEWTGNQAGRMTFLPDASAVLPGFYEDTGTWSNTLDYVNYIVYDNNRGAHTYVWAADDGEWPLEQRFRGGTSCDPLVAPFVGISSSATTVVQSKGLRFTGTEPDNPFGEDPGALWYLRTQDNRTGREFIALVYMNEGESWQDLQEYLADTLETLSAATLMQIRDLSDLDVRDAADYLRGISQ